MTEFPITDEDGLVQCTCETDELLRLLADASRRRVVVLLENCDSNWIRIDQMAQLLSMTCDGESVSGWKRDLHHIHLPMLEDTGVIEYDRQDNVVRYYHCDVITDVLDAIDSE
ncbi:ArsR family transcriptional regulator [Haloterrigena sp. H1]|uniref:DUF7344 domain-containing protein n=1 Tax=Haloterrigena sp. H1 TaxID=2552943 RepID=UPI00110DD5EE|nr:ArsR family transcriptional regulator [Haloterrigena sp. H1]TMT81619.1 ArsR family transcriptional regulator [Haloterrigena sp. H1]